MNRSLNSCSQCKSTYDFSKTLHCLGCCQDKPFSEFVIWATEYPNGEIEKHFQVRFCKGKCFDKRYGDIIGKKTKSGGKVVTIEHEGVVS